VQAHEMHAHEVYACGIHVYGGIKRQDFFG